MRAVAGEQHLADVPLVSLRVVVVDRATDLVGERLAGPSRLAWMACGDLWRDVFGKLVRGAGQADRDGQAPRLVDVHTAVGGKGMDERLGAEADDARELRRVAHHDDQIGDARADADQRRGPPG